MSVAIVLVAILPALLAAAAVFDLTSYTIPNIVPLAMIVLFVAFILAIAVNGHAMSWDNAGLHLLAGAIGLIAGMAMFAAGWVGGGDAKLFAVASLWLGWDSLLEYTLMASILGGVLTVALLALRRISLPSLLTKQPWLARLANPQAGVPYGVALSLAALLILPDTQVFQLAAVS